MQVMVGELPGDFLRISSTPQQQQAYADERVARVLQAQQNFMPIPANIKGRLNISIVQVSHLLLINGDVAEGRNFGLILSKICFIFTQKVAYSLTL